MLLLGNQVLYPEKAMIPSIAVGKSAKVQLSYKVPDNIYLGAYTMRGLVNPYGTISGTNEGDNVFIIPRVYFISDNWVEAKVAAGGCGYGSKYLLYVSTMISHRSKFILISLTLIF